MHVLVMAKEPVPGRVKTRLCPPCTPEEAAELAEAALADTLEAATSCGADRVVLALDGSPGPWCPAGVDIVAQVSGPFDRRLAAAWEAAGGPGVQIGMDTPQVRAADLDDAMCRLAAFGDGAVLGPAADGGWWLVGLHRADPRAFLGIAMSRADTGARQRERLEGLGLRVTDLAAMRDVDTFADAIAVARQAPHTRFASRVDRLATRVERAS